MAETSATMGFGEESYLQFVKESSAAYGTPVVTNFIDVPINPGTVINGFTDPDSSEAAMGSRLKREPIYIKKRRPFSVQLDAYPTLVGQIINFFLGAATTDSAEDTTAYPHTWLAIMSGLRVGTSFTMRMAKGAALAEQIDGCVLDEIIFSGDSNGNIKLTLNGAGQGFTTGITRETTWSYPAAADPPFNFGHVSWNITPIGGTRNTIYCENWSITLKNNQNLERYHMTSAANGGEILQPTFMSIPTAELTLDIDADSNFLTFARAGTGCDITMDATHNTSLAGAVSTYHALAIELPHGKLETNLDVPFENGLLKQSLKFDCSYGGVTTGSGADSVTFEIRVVDKTATYTA